MQLIKKLLMLCIVALVLSACTGPMYVTSVPTYNNTIDKVVAAIESQGYTFKDKKHDHRNEICHSVATVEGVSNSSNWIPNELVNYDTYNFVDDNGNTMSFSVQYRSRTNHTSGAIYYTDVQTDGCFTSNSKDYERLCGEGSPLRMLDAIQKDMIVKP